MYFKYSICEQCSYYHEYILKKYCIYYIPQNQEVSFKIPQCVYIPNYESLYVINPKGEIYSLLHSTTHKLNPTWHEKIKSYLVHLTKENKQKTYHLQRLVASTFILNPYHKRYIQFKDKNKKNCSVSNLQWSDAYCVTYPENFKRRGFYQKKTISL